MVNVDFLALPSRHWYWHGLKCYAMKWWILGLVLVQYQPNCTTHFSHATRCEWCNDLQWCTSVSPHVHHGSHHRGVTFLSAKGVMCHSNIQSLGLFLCLTKKLLHASCARCSPTAELVECFQLPRVYRPYSLPKTLLELSFSPYQPSLTISLHVGLVHNVLLSNSLQCLPSPNYVAPTTMFIFLLKLFQQVLLQLTWRISKV